MPNYKSYPTVKTTPNRKTRKGERNKIFQHNRMAKKLERKARDGE